MERVFITFQWSCVLCDSEQPRNTEGFLYKGKKVCASCEDTHRMFLTIQGNIDKGRYDAVTERKNRSLVETYEKNLEIILSLEDV